MHPVLTIPLLGEIKAYTLFTILGALAFAAVALPKLTRLWTGEFYGTMRRGDRPRSPATRGSCLFHGAGGCKPPSLEGGGAAPPPALLREPPQRGGLCRGLQALALLAAMAAAFLISARLWNVAVNHEAYGGVLKWYSLRLAGFSLYGGVLGSALVLIAWAKISRRRLLPLLDTIVISSALAFALARVGCFLNGCCYGLLTRSPLGVEFPMKSEAQATVTGMLTSVIPNMPTARHPTQLYELALALLGLIPALLIGRKLKPGSAFLIYGAWFSASRLAILPLRSLTYSDTVVQIVYPALYITLTVLGITAAAWVNREKPGLAE